MDDNGAARGKTSCASGRRDKSVVPFSPAPRWLALAFAALVVSMLFAAAPVLAAPAPDLITRFAGISGACERPTPGPAASSALCYPTGVAVDAHGNVYIADPGNYDIEQVGPEGVLSVIAGKPGEAGAPTQGPAAGSKLGDVQGIAVDAHGNLYLADSSNDVVEKITPQGTLSILAGKPGVAGPPTEGPATSSDLSEPTAVAVDGSGDVYVDDYQNAVVEEIVGGELSIIAGKVGESGPPTPGPARESDLGGSLSLAVDGSGNVYIGDYENYVVEKVTPAGTLSIFAGKVDESQPPSEGPATSSHLGTVYGLTVDASGNVYIVNDDDFIGADCAVDEVAGGDLVVIAGTELCATPSYGEPASESPLFFSWGIAVDSSGVLYLADFDNSTIDRIGPETPALPAPSLIGATTTTTTTASPTLSATAMTTAIATPAPCRSTRTETIHWRLPPRVGLAHILIMLNGKAYERLPGGARKAMVSLLGRGQGSVAITVTGTTGHRERYTSTRTFEPCIAPRPTGVPPNLYLRHG